MATSSKAGDKPAKTSKPAAKAKAKPAADKAKTVKKASASAAVKPAVKKIAPKAAPAKSATKKATPGITPEQRRYYVEVAAYYIAERRGFHGGSQLDDWVTAESEIDRLLREGVLNP